VWGGRQKGRKSSPCPVHTPTASIYTPSFNQHLYNSLLKKIKKEKKVKFNSWLGPLLHHC